MCVCVCGERRFKDGAKCVRDVRAPGPEVPLHGAPARAGLTARPLAASQGLVPTVVFKSFFIFVAATDTVVGKL